MNEIVHMIEINSKIEEAMRSCNNKENVEPMIAFLKSKTEKYTYFLKNNRYFINSFFPSFPSRSWSRLVDGLYKIASGRRTPFQADLVVTGRCHCKCWHCFRSKYNQKDDMPIEKIKEILQSLSNMGTSTVGITGGEPMLRKDIVEIISLIPDEMEGQLYTTGVNINKNFVNKINNTNLTRCIISLDHYDKEKVCQMRNNKNAFDDVLRAIDNLHKNNIYMAVTVCVNEELLVEDELFRYVNFVKKLGVNEIRMVVPIPQGNLEGRDVSTVYVKAAKTLSNLKKKFSKDVSSPVIVNFSELESSQYLGCGAGSNYFSVNSDGMVTPCVAVPLSFGNVYEKSLEQIYDEMKEYFSSSFCSCYGVASNCIMHKNSIHVEKPPLDIDTSKQIADQCKLAMWKSKLFQFYANND